MQINWSGVFRTPEQERAHQEQQEAQARAYRAKQKEPYYVPPGFEAWTIATINRLPASDPRRIRLTRALVNHEDVTLQEILRGEP
jgi:hypothetical protein